MRRRGSLRLASRRVRVLERLDGRRSSSILRRASRRPPTTVPVATASRSFPWKWPVKPGKIVVLFVCSIGPVPFPVMSTVTSLPEAGRDGAVDARRLQRRGEVNSAGPEPAVADEVALAVEAADGTVMKSLSSVASPVLLLLLVPSDHRDPLLNRGFVRTGPVDDVVRRRFGLEAMERLRGRRGGAATSDAPTSATSQTASLCARRASVFDMLNPFLGGWSDHRSASKHPIPRRMMTSPGPPTKTG